MRTILLFFSTVLLAATAFAQPDSLDYQNDYYAGKRNLQEDTPVSSKNIVMLGNSLTERGYWSEYFQNKRILNRGIGGDCINGMLARLDAIVAGKPRAIFIMAGVNDLIFSKITPENLMRQYERLVRRIQTESPRTKIYIESLLPLNEAMNETYFKGKNDRIERFNELLQQFAASHQLVYINIWHRIARNATMPTEYTVDGIHLNADGYRVWINELSPYIK